MNAALSRVRLQWPGKRAKALVPAAELEVVRPGSKAVTLVHGDNLLALHALQRTVNDVVLAYMDPPFNTGRQHSRVHRRKDAETGQIIREETVAFDDRWDGLDDFLSSLRPRIEAVRELLAPNGCLVVHVDPKTSHYVKVMCDEVFGPDCFASEIVWRYRRWPARTPNFQRVHDVLLRYVRDPSVQPRFHQLYEPLAQSTVRTWGTTKQRAVVDTEGRRKRSSSTEEPTLGTPLGDVWEIGILAPVAKERTGYPTQKPEALLQRLVEACTQPGDTILDPYAGSGTTLAVAARLGRPAIGIDQSPEALDVTRRRLLEQGIRAHEAKLSSPKIATPRRKKAG